MTKNQRKTLSSMYDILHRQVYLIPDIKKQLITNQNGEEVEYGDIQDSIYNAMEVISDYLNN